MYLFVYYFTPLHRRGLRIICYLMNWVIYLLEKPCVTPIVDVIRNLICNSKK